MSTKALAFLTATALAFAACSAGGGDDATPDSRTTPGVTETRDVVYRTVDGVELALDVYAPGGEGLPAVLVIHGGDWNHGSKNTFAAEGRALAEAGFVAFVADYRLAPLLPNTPPAPRTPDTDEPYHAPAQAEDLRHALLWIRENGADFGADPERVGALGSSAGGNLAQLLGATGEVGSDKVDAVVSWSGPSLAGYRDPESLAVLNRCPGPRCPIGDKFGERGTGAIILNYIGCPPKDCPERWQEASPFENIGSSDAPMYLAVSTGESLDESQSEAMVEALEDAGVPARMRLIQGRLHARAFEDQVIDESIAFLRMHLAAE